MNIKIILEFDGTNFEGWQKQKNKRTVQGELENAFKNLIDGEFKIIGCCRTDSGVHALNYTCNIKIFGNLKVHIEKLKFALNGLLSEDIYIKNVELVDEHFNARYNAKFKVYRYRILTYPSPLLIRYGFYPKFKIDSEKLKEVENIFIGKRDFRNICAKTEKSGICNVVESYWIFNENYYDYFIKADRFLYKMVRSIVGLMLLYSANKISKEEILEVLEFKRKFIPYIVPAKGLTLIEVLY
ncbi:MAG: tRNA pseudouridine(38-40) synthase TruA [candidate division WOR-3 bacterium]